MLEHAYGHLVTEEMLAGEGRYIRLDGGLDWWTRTARVFYSPHASDTAAQELEFARAHFFLPCRSVDPIGNESWVSYDRHDLLPLQVRDALGNETTAGERDAEGRVTPRIDYRALQPALVTDFNRNRAAFAYDALGRLAGVAMMGKAGESLGDSLAGFVADPAPEALHGFALDPLAWVPELLATRRDGWSTTCTASGPTANRR